MLAYQDKIKVLSKDELEIEYNEVNVAWRQVSDEYWSSDISTELSERYFEIQNKIQTVSDGMFTFNSRLEEKRKGDELSGLLSGAIKGANKLIQQVKESK